VLLFSDSAIMQEAAAWKKRHPSATPIDVEDEEAASDPRSVAHEEIEIVDVHGPWVTFRQVLNVDIDGGAPHRHVGRRAVVDVRTGKLATLATLFGPSEATRAITAGRASLAQLTDSIRRTGDDRAELARGTLDSFQFDSLSFGLSDVDRAPAVAFLVPGTSSDGEALAIYLPPIAVASPEWWSAVKPTLPEWARDSSRVHWARLNYEVAARPSTDGEALALVLMGRPGLRAREWPIATVQAPAYQLIPLDAPAVSPTIRDAIANAFDASSALDGLVQRASRRTSQSQSGARHASRSARTL
jgi:hypothetical protein